MITISEAADNLMTAIDVDIETGWVPADVASFAGLYGHVDANDYALEASPFKSYAGTWDAYMEHLNAIEAEADRRLRARVMHTLNEPGVSVVHAAVGGDPVSGFIADDESVTADASVVSCFDCLVAA